MNQSEFDVVVKKTVESIQQLLAVKGGEYAGSEDRLANFKRGAQLTGTTPLQVLFIYMAKHYDAISTYVKTTSQGKAPVLSEPIEGRLDDLINYAILAKALIAENRSASEAVSAELRRQAEGMMQNPNAAQRASAGVRNIF